MVKKCCAHCGHVICYRGKGTRYECMRMTVDANGICDRFQDNVPPSEIMRRIDKKLKELEKIPDGQFKLREFPPFHQNYHVQETKDDIS